MIFQHGFPDHEISFNDFQIPVFAKSHTVLTPSLRGYPPSSVPPNVSDYTLDFYVSDMLAILDHEKADKVTLVGHDIGGAVSQSFALQHANRVEALILMNSPIFPVFNPLVNFDKEEQEYARYTIPYYTYEAGQPKNISTLVKNIRNDTYRAEISQYFEDSPIEGMLAFYKTTYPGPPYGKNVTFNETSVQRVPSMMLWGENDPFFSPKMLDGMEKWFEKGMRLVTIPGAGHWVHRDKWQRANEEIWSFLKMAKKI